MRKMVIFDDYTGCPRAYSIGPDEETAERGARERLARYCAKQLEPTLADQSLYTKRVENVS